MGEKKAGKATTFDVKRGMVLRTKKALKTIEKEDSPSVEIPAGTRVVGIKALDKGGLRVKVYDKGANHGLDIDTAFGNVTKSEKGRPSDVLGEKPAAKKGKAKPKAKGKAKPKKADVTPIEDPVAASDDDLVGDFEDTEGAAGDDEV